MSLEEIMIRKDIPEDIKNEIRELADCDSLKSNLNDTSLQEKTKLLSDMTNRIPDVVYQFYARPNGEFGFYYISNTSEQILGLKPDLEMYLERFTALVLPEYKEGFIASIKKATKELSEWRYEGMLKKPTGETIWFSGNSIPENRKNEVIFSGIVTDITARKDIEKKLTESEYRYKTFFETSHDAIMILEPPSWKFTSGNPAAIEMFGTKDEEEFISCEPWKLSPEYQPCGMRSDDKAKQMIETAMREGSHFFDWTHMRLNGKEFPATVLLSRLEISDNVFLQATVRDITVENKHIYDLEIAKQIAEESVIAKTNFINSMNHEFRTPMNGIMGFANILKDELKDPNQKEYLEYIEISCERLLKTINDTLVFSRLESDKYPISTKITDIVESTKHCTKLLRLTASRKFIYLIIESEFDKICVSIDPDAYQIIINNLIGNALKFTTVGGITIKIYIREDMCRVDITDTGCGIPKEFHENIFNEFRQANEGYAKTHEGSGLGLTIAKKLAMLQNGNLMLTDSSPEIGSNFRLIFPISVEEKMKLFIADTPLDEIPAAIKILAVEDDYANAIMIKKNFDKSGFIVDIAHNGNNAIDKSQKITYDIVIMDIGLRSSIDGFETMFEIKKNDKYHNTKFIAVSGYTDKENRLKMEKLFDDYLLKPYSRIELLKIIDKHLK